MIDQSQWLTWLMDGEKVQYSDSGFLEKSNCKKNLTLEYKKYFYQLFIFKLYTSVCVPGSFFLSLC